MKKSAHNSYGYQDHRIITLGDIDEENTNDIIQFIHEINYLDAEKTENKREPIKLIVNSYGGDIYRGLGVFDSIIHSTTPIHTICYGAAFSMGFMIMVSGHHRVASKNSTFMYHEGGFDLGMMKLTIHKHELKELERIEKLCDSLILERTNLGKKQLDNIKKQCKDWYISAEEALNYGIIDKII
jgi:ATP-dependent Clp protease protease subunit